jgi:hypothetical protein
VRLNCKCFLSTTAFIASFIFSPCRVACQPALNSAMEAAPAMARVSSANDTVTVGMTLFRARAAVLEILEGENACSLWFQEVDPRVTATFLSLTYRVAKDGSPEVIPEQNASGDWTDHGPYVARTRQKSGAGAIVTINGNGAFLERKGRVNRMDWRGSPGIRTNDSRIILVGPYGGATLEAQSVVLLHELAHVIGAIREDDSSRFGLQRSQENTDLVLRHCKAAVNRSRKVTTLIFVQGSPN